ncbi:metal ABC transporter ATP-binding protein [Microbacterium sp. YY-01]|uniref:metal ABC transporter ATP-binding protein n=1 Tax=Microbacterium sp. YY-01 TaxID=3421634 RepID=UPI003D184F7E
MTNLSIAPVVQAVNLAIGYPGNTVASGVSFSLHKGGMTALMGPNGAGKSTLIGGLLGVISLMEGTVSFFGEDIKGVRERIAYVPQNSSADMNFPITVFDVVALGTYPRRKQWRRRRRDKKTAIAHVLDKLALTELAHRQIGALSGGQRQRVLLARALVQEADLIVLDEPFAGVDHASERIIVEELRARADDGAAVLAVHHNPRTVEEYFDDIMLFDRGLISHEPCAAMVASNVWLTRFPPGHKPAMSQ